MWGRHRDQDFDGARRRFAEVWPGALGPGATARRATRFAAWRALDQQQHDPGDPSVQWGESSALDPVTGHDPVTERGFVTGHNPVTGHGVAVGYGAAAEGGDGLPGALRAPVESLPGGAVLGAFNPGRRGVRALAALAVVVVLVAGFLAWRARPRPEPVPISSAATEAGRSASSASTLVVAVQGKVRAPGLVRVPAGARVADAITAAGGALPGTDLTGLNLARRLVDGELIVVGVTPPPEPAGAPGGSAGSGRKVNINAATVAQLDSLPGIGPALAQRIIDYRTRHGGFRDIAELRRVPGIGDAKFAQIKELVTV